MRVIASCWGGMGSKNGHMRRPDARGDVLRYTPGCISFRGAVLTRFLDNRFVIVSGKGGTGKSTVCAAIAMAVARRGRRVLIAELNVRPQVPRIFGVEPPGYTPGPLFEGIESVNIVPAEAMQEYGVMKLKFRRLYRIVFENEVMRRMVRMIPGLNELLILGKLMNMESETIDRGRRPRWDMIVVDAPATGHGVSMFRLPQVILDTVSSGPLAEDSRRILELLHDEKRSSFNIVSLPEEMAVREAAELAEKLKRVLKIPPGFLFMNAVWPRALSSHERQLVSTFQDAVRGEDPLVDGVLSALGESEFRRDHQRPMVERARQSVSLPYVELPFVFSESFGIEQLRILSEHGAGAIGRHESSQ